MILDELKIISDTIKNIVIFIQQSVVIKPDFEEYLKTLGIKAMSGDNFNTACLNYIFERRLFNKSIIKIYTEENKNLSSEELETCEAIMNSIYSVFEIKKILKTGFTLYCVTNEKTYDVTSLVKMTAFRGLGIGQFVVARIAKYKDIPCLLGIFGVLPSYKMEDALKFSVAKLVENPEIAYIDNPQKLKELEEDTENLYQKFTKLFSTDEILTTSDKADDLIGSFNEYAELGESETNPQDYVSEPSEYGYFQINSMSSSYSNFIESSLNGFGASEKIYDVGVIFDRETGLYAVPFWGTFNKIYELEDYKSIPNYRECVTNFFQNDKIPANIIKRAASKHENFITRTNEILETEFTLKKILETYKSHYLRTKVFSPTTVLYRSKAFSNALGIIEDEREEIDIEQPIENKLQTLAKVGRNDPCPCGSGKKFKHCCGKNL